MEDTIVKKLSEMPSAKLVKIIQAALETMEETKQISFIAKYIDAKTSLTRLGANDSTAFLDEVEEFCQSCLNREYYSDEDDIEEYFSSNRYDSSYYDDDWDYDEYYADTEWAKTFEHLFKLSIMHIQSGDFTTGYEATAQLLSCLKEMEQDESFLGTDEPMSCISTDWNELFALHYEALFQYHSDSDNAVKIAFRRWLEFGSPCDEGFLSNVKAISIAKRYILEEIKASSEWVIQRLCFDLLMRLHERLHEPFDKSNEASALLGSNVYFHLCVVEGLCEKEHWHEAIESACTALLLIQPIQKSNYMESGIQNKIRAAIQSKLADAYEMLSDFGKAFETVKLMFQESPSFELYKRGRVLAEKTDNSHVLLALAEKLLIKDECSYSFSHDNLLRDIYSYEGEITKIMNTANSQEIGSNYYDRKYIAVSLVYRAMNNVTGISESLTEYLSSQGNQAGIRDMILSDIDDARRTELLLHSDGLLRGIISFHIDAAARNRYAKAAYYMCVLRDIFIFLKREDDFKRYFQGVIQQNSRRPALRDEMGIVYGKSAVIIKK